MSAIDSSIRPAHSGSGEERRLLITAGPTHEPIDAVRYIGNRSSGRLGVALADAAASRGWGVTLLLGPSALSARDTSVRTLRFRTAADLEELLEAEFPGSDVLVMAAAVADYRPLRPAGPRDTKLRREDGPRTLELEPTPDLIAGCAKRRMPGQVLVGFALEPAERLMESARDKLRRKSLDMVVANPLETMDAPTIDATLIRRDGTMERTDGAIEKDRFAPWLLERIATLVPRYAGA